MGDLKISEDRGLFRPKNMRFLAKVPNFGQKWLELS